MKQLIWDLPTRLFHWLFAFSFILAFGLAEFSEEKSFLFYTHVAFGFFIALLILWRIFWGFYGSRHALFKSFFFSPKEVLVYFKSVLHGKGDYHAGHNPGSGWVLLAIIIFPIFIVLSGFLQVFGGEIAKEAHEILPKLCLLLSFVHIAGVIMATKMNQENYTRAMFDGMKKASKEDGISNLHGKAAIVMIVFVLGCELLFLKSYDIKTGTIFIPGTSKIIKLSESHD